MSNYQRVQNEDFFKYLMIFGVEQWVHPTENELYTMVGNEKIQPQTERGYQLIQGIVRYEFIERFVVPPTQK